MAKSSSLRAKVSTQERVILPRAIRDRRGWTADAELIVKDRPEGVIRRGAPGTVDDVFGRLRTVDRIVSIEKMNQAAVDEARRRWLRKTRDRA